MLFMFIFVIRNLLQHLLEEKKDTCWQSICLTPYPHTYTDVSFESSVCVCLKCVCFVLLWTFFIYIAAIYPMPKLQTTGYYQSHIYAWDGITKETIVHSSSSLWDKIANLWSTWIDMQIFDAHTHQSHQQQE